MNKESLATFVSTLGEVTDNYSYDFPYYSNVDANNRKGYRWARHQKIRNGSDLGHKTKKLSIRRKKNKLAKKARKRNR